MSDHDQEQKTEDATPHKLEELKKKGQVVRSADVGAAASLLAALGALGFTIDQLAGSLCEVAARSFRLAATGRPLDALSGLLGTLAPLGVVLVTASFAAFAAGIAQTRVFAFEHAAPKLERLDPTSHLMQMLPTKATLIEVGKQLLKMGAIAFVVYRVIDRELPRFAVLSSTGALVAADFLRSVTGELLLDAGIAFGVIAAGDYALTRHKFMQDAKMTKQEVKDEHKQQDGNPQIRAQIRRRMREMLRSRGNVADVAKATVVVTNPTHYAVALRYAPEKDAAPIVLAKGTDEQALEIRTVARRHGVPMVENRPLARALFADAKVGRPIPVDSYRAVAEVIAFVMQLRGGSLTKGARA